VRNISLLRNVQTGPEPPNPHPHHFTGIKLPRREVNHSPPSITELKNAWSYTSAPPICFHGGNRDNDDEDTDGLLNVGLLAFQPQDAVGSLTMLYSDNIPAFQPFKA
jgi:hypothetical protein